MSSMTYNIILAAAVVNTILGVLALTKGRSGLNLSFAIMSILLAMWNLFVPITEGGTEGAEQIMFMIIFLIPPAGVYFVISLYRIKKGPIIRVFNVVLALAALNVLFLALTFFLTQALEVFKNDWYRRIILVYEFFSLAFGLWVLLYYYRKIKFKQEKIKIAYVITACFILFFGGMMDMASGANLFHFPVEYLGNICNVIYALIIFIAVFRMRLFNIQIFFKNFIIYTILGAVVSGVYVLLGKVMAGNLRLMAAVFFVISLLVLYYARELHKYISLFVETFSGRLNTEEALAEFTYIKSMQLNEEEKVMNILMVIKKHLEMDAAIYLKEGDYFILKWSTGAELFGDTVEGAELPEKSIIRYDSGRKKEIAVLDSFKSEIIIPVPGAGESGGVICGKKQTADISFSQDELDLLNDMASTIAQYIKTYMLQKKLVEEENMKRIGMMAHQMAHEIKNPLAALWGATQLLEGKSDAEKENIDIIQEEMKRLTGILDSWQDFSKDIKLNREETGLTSLVAEVVKIINLQKHKAEIRLEKPEEEIMIAVDHDRLKQVLINVIINSVQALVYADRPVIKIRLVKKEKYIDIKIRDNGPGIKKQDLAKVKQPLYTSKTKGTGLGLAVCERIMKAHEGAFLIESDGESYTEVTLSLPV